jgi:hypothetical protein
MRSKELGNRPIGLVPTMPSESGRINSSRGALNCLFVAALAQFAPGRGDCQRRPLAASRGSHAKGARLPALHPVTVPTRRNACYAALTRRFPTLSRILITLASVHSVQDAVGVETLNLLTVKTEQLQLVAGMR